MKNLTIIKVGGKVVENEQSLKKLLTDFSTIKGLKVLIHGGGNIATELANKMGLTVQMVNGRRITDAEMLKVVVMVYAGMVNKNVVAGLQSYGCNAIGLSGADLDIIRAIKRPVKEIDYGFVGDVVKVNGNALAKLLENGFIPVIAPLTHDGNGQMLNTNADDITYAVAMALTKFFNVKLIFCFDKKGVMLDMNDENSVISNLTIKYYNELKDKKIVNTGMIPKLDNGFKSLENGVKQVFITDVNGIENENPGGTELKI